MGTYWVAFEVRSGQDLYGTMGDGAPSPLSDEAFNLGTGWYEYDGLDIGVRIYADLTQQVPEPATLALVGLGLASIGFARKKKLA